ncbi:hypothetical protein [Rathayibacter tritici]|uniref:GerMN domain-containing protein n=1 Tax=Rathayibacter tritici TaxID=33888 RepID=A0A160KPY5_9MICO|nr:hypothetical protein [Rathayibacter tritici]AND15179.1 hypothetical protein A6122_0009 [Rathayibacter tritici]PPI47410.1 hypothetical protein C5D18_03300 [Rathayibacter tritici]
MHRRTAFVCTVATLGALALSGCTADEPATTATVGLGRGGERAEVLGVVVVCSGSIDGLDLAASDSAPAAIGDTLRRITRWVSPSPVTQLGATDLSGRTIWPADREIEQFPPGVDFALGAYATDRSVLSRPVVFTAEQFDTLSVGEIIVGDVRDGTSKTLSVQEFLGVACRPR